MKTDHPETIKLTVEKLLYGGDGLAHFGKQACFVKHVIPGETVKAEIREVKKQYIVASPVEILIPSDDRITAECPYFKVCGGCQWQHIKYPQQLYWKKEIVGECMHRIGRFDNVPVPDPAASPLQYNYRSAAAFQVKHPGKPVIGFYRNKTHEIIPVESCLLLAPALNRSLAECRKLFEKSPEKFSDVSAVNMVYINDQDCVVISFKSAGNREPLKLLYSSGTDRISVHESILHEKIMDLFFMRNSRSFYQVNFPQNQNMINIVLQYLEPCKNRKILDLFCGSGNFSLFAACKGSDVTGIDFNSSSIKEAVKNAQRNRIKNCRFIRGNANRIPENLLNPSDCDTVILNPPRDGCSADTIEKISGLNPSVIIYVSCNPSTLARDLARLVKNSYDIEHIQPLDMFPQTYHIECIVKLIRR